MTIASERVSGHPSALPVHRWLKRLNVALVPGHMTPLLHRAARGLGDAFGRWGHTVLEEPVEETDLVITTAPFGEPLGWRDALLFTARRRFGLEQTPTLITLMPVTPGRLHDELCRLAEALAKKQPDPADFVRDGLAPEAWQVLVEQGGRGGPILSLMRILQAQTKSIRLILMVGNDEPLEAYHFDLVGSFPRSDGSEPTSFYDDIVLRIATAVSTPDVTDHTVLDDPIPRDAWEAAEGPGAMCRAGLELGQRGFFTDMIRIADLVNVPAVSDAVAEQYSEGCFATWDPDLDVMITTITGSARPVDKGNVTADELAAVKDVRPTGMGATIRPVQGRQGSPPSSEAVEMRAMDDGLPSIVWEDCHARAQVPIVRSKLHGHRGIAAYDPATVEYVPLDPPFYRYIVSCGTKGQAEGICAAFTRAETLRHPDDPRQLAFTILPGHGVVIVEKWLTGRAPFESIWTAMDEGRLQIDNHIPQGDVTFRAGNDGRQYIVPDETPLERMARYMQDR